MAAQVDARAVLIGRLDSRYSFTSQFLAGAALQARAAFGIELVGTPASPSEDQCAHRSYVVGAIMQSVAALESEIWEVVHHGPGHHLGSNGVDGAARAFLARVADLIDDQRTLERYECVLHLLHKAPLQIGIHPFQDAELVVGLRNEIVHYKSKWGDDLAGIKLFKGLESKNHRRPPFFPESGVNFFPHQCLSADCAAWAVETCAEFLATFYCHLGVIMPTSLHKSLFAARPDEAAQRGHAADRPQAARG